MLVRCRAAVSKFLTVLSLHLVVLFVFAGAENDGILKHSQQLTNVLHVAIISSEL